MGVFGIERTGVRELAGLWEALGLDEVGAKIISITGAGGKTSVMFRLAEELTGMGRRVIVTTSTHIAYPEGYQVVVLNEVEEMREVVWQDRVLVVGGSVIEKEGAEGDVCWRKLAGMDVGCIGKLGEWCDVLLIEADGSRRLPLKVPAEHEPVIIPETDVVIGCAGISCVGERWEEKCFRAELAEEVLRREGYGVEERIRGEDVAHILVSLEGTRKNVDGRAYRIVLNQVDDEMRVETGMGIVREIGGKEKVVMTSWLIG